jgi:hypothetical protein
VFLGGPLYPWQHRTRLLQDSNANRRTRPAHETLLLDIPFSLQVTVRSTVSFSVQRLPTRTLPCVPISTRDSP